MNEAQGRQTKPVSILFVAGLVCFWCVFILFIALASIPYNPLSLPQVNKMNVLRIIPEGWGFFTRNPVEPSYYLYQKNKEGVYILINPSAPEAVYYFGISRRSRRINVELHSMLSQLKDTSWEKVEQPRDIQLETNKLISIHSDLSNPLLRGDYILLELQRTPWAWSRQKIQPIMPYRKIRVHILP